MTQFRALIVGCGRMGSGRDHRPKDLLYTHPQAYQALSERVTLVGFVDRVLARAEWAAKEWGVSYFGDHIPAALRDLAPDIVSICTPPSDRREVVDDCNEAPSVAGIWCEKPYWLDTPPKALTQVNFIRRFDARHIEIAERRTMEDEASLFVICANDIHTTCHFSDLARFWHIQPENLHYLPFHGPSLYILREPGLIPGRYEGWRDTAFTGGGVSSGFMEAALSNLLDAVEGKADLVSSADNAIESEQWAQRILYGGSNLR